MNRSTSPVILEIHTLVLDLLPRDVPPSPDQTDSGRLRPFLTLCYAPQASRMMSYRLHAGAPDRRTVAIVLHEALVQLQEPADLTPIEDQPLQGPLVFEHSIHWDSPGIHIRYASSHQRISGASGRFFSLLTTRLLHSVSTTMGDQGTRPGGNRELVTLAEIERMLSHFSKIYCHTANRTVERYAHSLWQVYRSTKRADLPVFASLLEEPDDQNTTTVSKRDQEPRMEPSNCADIPPALSIVVVLDPSLLMLETQDGPSADERMSPASEWEEQLYLTLYAEQSNGSTRATCINGIKGVGRSIGVDRYFCPQGEK